MTAVSLGGIVSNQLSWMTRRDSSSGMGVPIEVFRQSLQNSWCTRSHPTFLEEAWTRSQSILFKWITSIVGLLECGYTFRDCLASVGCNLQLCQWLALACCNSWWYIHLTAFQTRNSNLGKISRTWLIELALLSWRRIPTVIFSFSSCLFFSLSIFCTVSHSFLFSAL